MAYYNPEGKIRVTVWLDKTVTYRAKSRAILETKTLSEVVNELLEKYGNDLTKVASEKPIEDIKNIREIVSNEINKNVSMNPKARFVDISKKRK